MTRITGIDYAPTQVSAERTRKDWQAVIAGILKSGGRRRVENDGNGLVTFLHGRDGAMLHEIYDNVQAP